MIDFCCRVIKWALFLWFFLLGTFFLQATTVDFASVELFAAPWVEYRASNYDEFEESELPFLAFEQISQIHKDFKNQLKQSSLNQQSAWIGNNIPKSLSGIFDCGAANWQSDTQAPYVRRVQILPGSRVCLMGDLHGSICSLVANLLQLVENGFLTNEWLLAESNYLCFLGDIVDRGIFSIECWAAIMHLFNKNPGRVFIARGNHEEYQCWGKVEVFPVCMSTEIDNKFSNFFENLKIKKWFSEFCQTLPHALILESGINSATGLPARILCCHGGIEPGVNLNILFQADYFYEYMLTGPCYQGFNWSDFTGIPNNNNDYCWTKNSARGFNCGYLADIVDTQRYLALFGLSAIFRGHQDLEYSFKLVKYGSQNLVCWRDLLVNYKCPRSNPVSCSCLRVDGVEMDYFLNNDFTVPVFTLSTAKEARRLLDEGFVIAQTAENLSDWTIYPHIYNEQQLWL